MGEGKSMDPVSSEDVETDGVYTTEWGREQLLKRGDKFPSDVMMGDTEWKLDRLPNEEQKEKLNHERGKRET
ncbi:hypothetical protein EHS13_16955 [Paenibacillus psychroresistens]|uniref:Uncharacterized protein n=1 Tax=Paenibacillus psychroresistens TaxID=1778678 RepID=A0A6B8RLE7_9BACL|nr:hypothetical protein [Paenibacillus psychroresistens]QGQ96452.1 hypothetical protein EHS13_16955 [Paenibacillus psychroresistens]